MRLPFPSPPQILLPIILALTIHTALIDALPAAGSSSGLVSMEDGTTVDIVGLPGQESSRERWQKRELRVLRKGHSGEHEHQHDQAAEEKPEEEMTDWEKELSQMGGGHGFEAGVGGDGQQHQHQDELHGEGREHQQEHHQHRHGEEPDQDHTEGEQADVGKARDEAVVSEDAAHEPNHHHHHDKDVHDSSPSPLSSPFPPSPPDHHHHSHDAPKLDLDEASILLWHGPQPLSFVYYDWFLSPAEQLYFTRTGLSTYGNATTEMSGLNRTELEIWQEGQLRRYGRAERGMVMGGDGLGHRWLILVHILMMALGYWGILPIILALKAAKYRGVATTVGKLLFATVVVIGWICGTAYKRATPNLYRGHSHNINGNILLLATLAIFSLDLITVWKRLSRFRRADKKNVVTFSNIVLRNRRGLDDAAHERVRLASDAYLEDIAEEDESDATRTATPERRYSGSRMLFTAPWATKQGEQELRDYEAQDLDDAPPRSRNSSGSDRTLRGSGSSSPVEEAVAENDFSKPCSGDVEDAGPVRIRRSRSMAGTYRPLGNYLFHFFSRGLVVWAYIVSATGVVVYTGLGRAGYLPSLLAHLIKGSIFFFYGLLTFARYLGAFAEYGWAWNAKPSHKRHSRVPSAEFVESSIIWFYGITNTWLERIGAAPGSPYTLHNIQHISIAILFWGAGFVGMALESKSVRDLLGFSATRGRVDVAQPRSYSFSFNPFPALTILILGISMSTHSQDYVFQITIHVIWGYLLAAFSVFRLLTYFLLWLAPPSDSILPSRPPTEAIGSFCLAAGGIVFVLSDEEVAYAAMRAGYADGMMFTNVTAALVGGLFSWVLAVLAVKGWAMRRCILASETKSSPRRMP